MYPLTEILNPGPISNGKFANRARFATALEFIEERSDFSRDIPSFVDDVGATPEIGAGASGSDGVALYMIS